ncbi:MAG: glycosyltransferase [Bdellovibrionales bacterium]|nr:glycosyltransferase [Bdellovibrionales bacterium]
MSNTLVVLPSYNEKENLVDLIKALWDVDPQYFICVVDDNSPDGTSQIIAEFQSSLSSDRQKHLHLITRPEKDGRGGAVRRGLQWGLKEASENFESFIEMDCDFSHPPTDLPKGLELLRSSDVVLGSRYPDGKIVGWPLSRKILSFCANLLARILISFRISDYTNGFRFYNKKSAELMLSLPQKNKGYIYLSETLSYFLRYHHSIASFPILFVNRERGVSNTSFKEVSSALTGIFKIALNYRFKSEVG